MHTTTVIPAHTRVEGRIETAADITIEGRCDGDVASGGTVIVAAGATCKADLRARRAEVFGEVIGSIVCTESVVVGAGARVVGDVRAPDVAVDASAKVEGRVDLLAPAPDEAEVRRARIGGGNLRRPSAPSPIAQLIEHGERVSEFDLEVPTVDERAKLRRRAIPKPPRPRGRSKVVQKPPGNQPRDAE